MNHIAVFYIRHILQPDQAILPSILFVSSENQRHLTFYWEKIAHRVSKFMSTGNVSISTKALMTECTYVEEHIHTPTNRARLHHILRTHAPINACTIHTSTRTTTRNCYGYCCVFLIFWISQFLFLENQAQT